MASDWLKFHTGKVSTSPDTMAVLVLRKNDVSDLWTWFCGHAQKYHERSLVSGRNCVPHSVYPKVGYMGYILLKWGTESGVHTHDYVTLLSTQCTHVGGKHARR